MAARTSNGSGPWHVGATWVGGVAPGIGDTATIANGHNVEVATGQNISFGTSPAEGSTSVLVINSGGTLTINGRLNSRGDITMSGSNSVRSIIMNGGSILEFDASNASSPSSQNYRLLWTSCYPGTQPPLQINGTALNRAQIRSNAGGGNAYFGPEGVTPTVNYYGIMDSSYCTFTRIGDASNPMAILSLPRDGSFDPQPVFLFKNNRMDACGAITLNGGNISPYQ